MWDMVKDGAKEKGESKDSVLNFMRKKLKSAFQHPKGFSPFSIF
jgi:hypothetical protein